MKIQLTCIGCPNSCNMDIEHSQEKIESIENALCSRGKAYAEKEITKPERVVTTTIKVLNSKMPLVSVKSNKPIPKELAKDVVDELKNIVLKPPLCIGQIVVKNILDTQADIIITQDIK
ncbi:MAG: DUF1667 domain-containing protein [Deltaproteobacteria bacterium]